MLVQLNPALIIDFYKNFHRQAMPKDIKKVYETWTMRSGKYAGVTEGVVFGHQAMAVQWLVHYWNEMFFKKPKDLVVNEYARYIKYCLFDENPDVTSISTLHDLGYLPIELKGLPEGTIIPMRCPSMTLESTNEKFAWITGYLETLISQETWDAYTSATISNENRKVLEKWAIFTGSPIDFCNFQSHDFSARGMNGVWASMTSAMGHLTSSAGTDTIVGIQGVEQLYGANIESELVGCSVNATEHLVQCANGLDEYATFNRLLTEVAPLGILSVVSDTWDYWKVLTETVPQLKEVILARKGKLVIRPDSGDPYKIICGDGDAPQDTPQYKGSIQLLWETFGGTLVTSKNGESYKVLDEHIGLIYGDSITTDLMNRILGKLAHDGFASCNVVFGVGSYTYQHVTRDTLGQALKGTNCIIGNEEVFLFKDPKTDDGTKKSQRGCVVVYRDNSGKIQWKDGLTFDEASSFKGNMLTTFYKDSKMTTNVKFSEIRQRIAEHRQLN